jgi:SAM-dependent methyltransferase
MNQFVNGVARAMAETVDCPGPILEIGSYQVAGQESLGNLRSLFPGKAYTGVDKRSGPGVDQVADVEALPFADASVGTVLAFNLFEHVARFWKGLDEVWRVLRPDGVLLMSCPFYFHIHAYPGDYWRFTPEAMKLLLERFPSKVLGWNGPRSRPAHVWAVGLREAHAAVT